jgi:serine/threonine protein kinase
LFYKARCKKTGQIIAAQKICRAFEPKKIAELLQILSELYHNNIVRLERVLYNYEEIFLAFEYAKFNLHEIICYQRVVLTEGEIKNIMMQLLKGVAKCHDKHILHRDLKPSHIMISEDGIVKIRDFDLAVQQRDDIIEYSNKVYTLWYRAPELVSGTRVYGGEIDMWAVG